MHSFHPVQEVISLFPDTQKSSVLKTVLKTVHYNMRSKSVNSLYVNQPSGVEVSCLDQGSICTSWCR